MWQNWIYLRPNRRRPVRLKPYTAGEDLQKQVPADWCGFCGREVYSFEKTVCEVCERWNFDVASNEK